MPTYDESIRNFINTYQSDGITSVTVCYAVGPAKDCEYYHRDFCIQLTLALAKEAPEELYGTPAEWDMKHPRLNLGRFEPSIGSDVRFTCLAHEVVAFLKREYPSLEVNSQLHRRWRCY